MNLNSVYSEDIPFGVFKQQIHAEKIIPFGAEVVVEDGNPKNPNDRPDPKKFDNRVKVILSGIKYELDFWNVGGLLQEGFIFKSDYSKAKLTVSYVAKEAYKYFLKSSKFPVYEKKEVDIPYINKITYDLEFSGGPNGYFYYVDHKNKRKFVIAKIENGQYIKLYETPEEIKFLVNYNVKKRDIIIPLSKDDFQKWIDQAVNCTDSGVRVDDYYGEVYIRKFNADDDEWDTLEIDTPICEYDHIKTGEDSYVVLALNDLSRLKMKPETEIIISHPRHDNSKIKLIAGKIWVNFKTMVKHGTMDVETSQGVAGIKGTTFSVSKLWDKTIVKLIEGSIEYKTKDSQVVNIKSGDELIVNSNNKNRELNDIKDNDNKINENIKEHMEYIEKNKFNITKENKFWNILDANLKNKSNRIKNNKINLSQRSQGFNVFYLFSLILITFLVFAFFIKQKGIKNKQNKNKTK